jgi:hypothetical protein
MMQPQSDATGSRRPDNNAPLRKWISSAKVRAFLLGVALLVAGVVVFPVAYWRASLPGLWAAAAAWGVCFLSGLLAFGLIELFNDRALHQVLWSTVVRLSLPLGACVAVHVHGGILADAGFVYYILAFYLITLTVETGLVAGGNTHRPTESQAR